jgi:signal transduction histidine kinase
MRFFQTAAGAVVTPFRANPRLDRKLFTVVALPVAIVVLLAVQSYVAIEQELTDVALSRRSAIARLAAVTLSEKFDRLVDVGTSLATRVRFRELAAAGNWAEASAILAGVGADFPEVDRITLHDTDGVLRAAAPDVPGLIGRRFAGYDWFKGLTREWRPYVSEVYKRPVGPELNVFAVAIPIRGTGRDAAGILLLQARLDTFFGWTKEVEIGEGGYLYIVDREGNVAFHPNVAALKDQTGMSRVTAVREALGGKRGIEVAFDDSNQEQHVIAYEPIPKYGWAVIVEQPARTAFGARDRQLTRLMMAYVLIGLLCVSVALLAARVVLERRRAEDDEKVRTELERRVAERTSQFEASNKELEGFSYSVSHDLRSPLRAIDGYSRMLEEDYLDRLDDEGRRLLGVIRKNSGKMARLIDDLLAFSRFGRKPLDAVEIDMNALVTDAIEEVKAVNPGTAVEFRVASLPPARGDRSLMRQAWINLLSNAVKYSSAQPAPVVEIASRNGPDGVEYSVKDNGVGFDMKYYDKLFGVFQRLHAAEEFPGTGVGLAIVQRIVTRHGGRVWAEGRVGEGATFHFTLPN